jgi:hypothetical protein
MFRKKLAIMGQSVFVFLKRLWEDNTKSVCFVVAFLFWVVENERYLEYIIAMDNCSQ